MNFRLRISKWERKVVDKGYTPNWTYEIFEIDKVLLTKPVTYKIVDLRVLFTNKNYKKQNNRHTELRKF